MGGTPLSRATALSFKADPNQRSGGSRSAGAGRATSGDEGRARTGAVQPVAAIASSPSSRSVWCARRMYLRAIASAARFAPSRC